MFLSLTEIVTGVAVTQASGGVQVALTCFVIAFPTLVATAFFVILWARPYVLYPPAEFAGGADVAGYVTAMRNSAATVRADVAADVENLRASVAISVNALGGRVETIESGLSKLLNAHEDARAILEEYEREKKRREKEAFLQLSSFEQNAQYQLEVVGLNPGGDILGGPFDRAKDVSADLARAGFKTSARGWNREYYLAHAQRDAGADTVFLIHRGDDAFIVERLRSILRDLAPHASLRVLTTTEALAVSKRVSPGVLDEEFDAAIVFDKGAG